MKNSENDKRAAGKSPKTFKNPLKGLVYTDLVGLVAIIMVFSVPIVAMITNFLSKREKMRLEHGVGKSNKELEKEMWQLTLQNEELKERLGEIELLLKQNAGDSREEINIKGEKEEIRMEEDNHNRHL